MNNEELAMHILQGKYKEDAAETIARDYHRLKDSYTAYQTQRDAIEWAYFRQAATDRPETLVDVLIAVGMYHEVYSRLTNAIDNAALACCVLEKINIRTKWTLVCTDCDYVSEYAYDSWLAADNERITLHKNAHDNPALCCKAYAIMPHKLANKNR